MPSKYFRASKIFIFLFIFLTASLWSFSPSFAIDEEVIDRYPSAEPPPQEMEKREEKEHVFYKPKERLEVTAFADVQQGYDNNVDLDSEHHRDGFLQGMANLDIGYEAMDNLKLKGGIDIFETIYYKYNVNNLSDISPYAGFDLEISPEIISRNRFIFDYFAYPNEKESTYAGIALTSYLRHYISEDIYHEGGFEYLRRWYPDRKRFLSTAVKGNKDRVDSRYRVKYNVGVYTERFLVKVSNQLSYNDSNDLYQDYYDYWMYRLKPSVMFFFTDKFYTDVSLIYKYTWYRNRTTTQDASKKERDNTYMLNTSLYYDISKNITFGVTYSYSENVSNDPFQKYSDSIVSGGIYYSF